MSSARSIIEISLILFAATIFRTTFGFGEALIAVPLLSLLLPVKVAAPITVLASIVIALVAVIREREHIHISSAKKLLLATICGLPFGLLLLRYVSEGATKGILGILILAFSTFSILRPQFLVLANDRLIWVFGFLAGITGGSYGMNGPPLAIYGAARGWSPRQFRATIQAYFLPASILGMLGYYFTGFWTKEVSLIFASSSPSIVIGILCGNLLNQRIDKKTLFASHLFYGLILIACMLMLQAVF